MEHVQRKDSVKWLMLAITHKNGVGLETLSEWYDIPANEIKDWFSQLKSGPVITALAEKEGVDIDEMARQYGVSSKTITEWFEELETESVEKAIDLINRYSQQRNPPIFRQTTSRVEFLDYRVVEENDWSVDDEDLFVKASSLDLDPKEHGRILVEPGETILEGAENRGFEWPYACRAGACANSAVLVKDGDIAMPGNNVLSEEQVNVLNARLTCVGVPVTEEVQLITNVQHLDQFDDLRLPSPLGGVT